MIGRALAVVLVKPRYACVTLLTALLLPTIVLLLPNLPLLAAYLTNPKVEIMLVRELLLGAPVSLGPVGTILLLLASLLSGLVLSLYLYARNRRRTHVSQSWFVGGGIFGTMIGAGCLACGPVLWGGLLAGSGAAGSLFLLPLHGAEFALLAIGLLSYALWTLARAITTPATCDSASLSRTDC